MPLASGVQVPCDVAAEADGPLCPRVTKDGRKYVAAREAIDGERPGYVPHWQTCPDPGFWAAERRRVLATAQSGLAESAALPESGARFDEYGPCAGCRRPGHVAYGPACKGLLCAACAAILAAWRATPRDARPPLTYPRWAPASPGGGAGVPP